MLLSWSEGHLLVLALSRCWVDRVTVEEDVVACGGAVGLGIMHYVVCGVVVIIRQDHRAEVDVIRRACRSIDLDGPNDAVTVLGGEVAVIPCRPVLPSYEGILPLTTIWGYRAFGD
jgi:hypothetical protein